jgi:hypothetical protein
MNEIQKKSAPVTDIADFRPNNETGAKKETESEYFFRNPYEQYAGHVRKGKCALITLLIAFVVGFGNNEFSPTPPVVEEDVVVEVVSITAIDGAASTSAYSAIDTSHQK